VSDIIWIATTLSIAMLCLLLLRRGRLLRNDEIDPRMHRGFMNSFVQITNVMLLAGGMIAAFLLLTGSEVNGLLVLAIALVIYLVRWVTGVRSL
jgi:hypothetical protein